MSLFFNKCIAKLVLFFLIFNLFPFSGINNSYALDWDGTNNLVLTIDSDNTVTEILWDNFTVNFSLTNWDTSEWSAYKIGYLINLPTWISFVSSDLWSPSSTITTENSTTTLVFETSDSLLEWMSDSHNLVLSWETAVGSSVNIWISAYANDNIYGRWPVPDWAPVSTLPGWVDVSNWGIDPTTDFPNDITIWTNLSNLGFVYSALSSIPFNVSKNSSSEELIWDTFSTSLLIEWNNKGDLKNFNIVDVIPNNREFLGFTQTWANIWSIDIQYNTPSNGQTTLDLSNITVPQWTDLDIRYNSRILTHNILSNTWGVIVSNTGSHLPENTASINTLDLVLGSATWNDGSSDILVDGTTKPSSLPQWVSTIARFTQLSKSVNNPVSVIWDTLTYTINFSTAKNVTLVTTWSGTYLEDILPDGITFVSDLTSSVSSGSALTFSGVSVISSWDDEWNTKLIWNLDSGNIPAESTGIITYSAIVDGSFEWGAWEQQYENTEALTNIATLTAMIDSTVTSWGWGYTDSNLFWLVSTVSDTATVTAPNPTLETRLISIETPDTTKYGDGFNAYDSSLVVPVGSKLEFVMSMDFPNVPFINAHILNALPLLTGHKENIYDIEFQTNTSLNDIYGVPVNFNTNDGTNSASTYNSLSLSGTTIPNASWVSITDPNNIEFDLWSWDGGNTFAIKFTVDILPDAPATIPTDGLHPLLDASIWDFSNDSAVKQSALLDEFVFNIHTPYLTIDKTVTATDVEAGSDVSYQVVIKNEWKATAYSDNIIDVMPENMDLQSYTISHSWTGATPLANSLVTQSGSELIIEYNTWATLGKSISPIDNTWSLNIDESIILINYVLSPNQNFVINNDQKVNTVSLDYYATPDVEPKEVYNYGPITSTDNFTAKQPVITREIISTTETNSVWLNDLEIWEEVTFRTTITLPNGTYNSSSFTEDLHSHLEFLTGSVISSSWALTFSTGTWFISNSVNFGTIINTNTGTTSSETIIIETQARSKNTASKWSNRKAEWEFYYNSLNKTINTPVDILEPLLNITKTVSPTTADAWDSITYTINISHNWSSNSSAYDLVLKDVIAGSNILYSSGTLAWIWNFTWTENELFSGTGLTLPVLLDGNTETITFDATVLTWALAWTTERNNVTLDYSTLDDDASIYEKDKSTSTYADLNIADVTIVHSITATDNVDTASSKYIWWNVDATIWEYVTYQIDVTIPELGFDNFTVTQDLPSGIKFLTGSIISNTVKSNTINTITISPDNKIIFDFGDIDNIGIWTWTGFTLSTTVVVQDNGANSAWNIKNSVATADFNTTYSKSNNTPNFDIVEPNLVITKDYSPNIWDAGDIIPTTITIQNTGTAPAYDIDWTDDLAPKTTSSWSYLASSSTWVLLPWASITYNYDSVLDNSVTYWDNLTWTASVDYYSLSGTPVEWKRSYTNTDTDVITIVTTAWVSKILTTSNEIKIWDITGYEVKVPVLEGTTDNITITDTIPAWLLINSGSITITSSAWVVYSGTVVPVIDIASETIIAGQNQTVTYAFTDIVNSDVDNATTDYLIVNYTTVSANTVDNNANDVKSEGVQANYNTGTTILNGSVQPATIIEPNISLDINVTYTNGYTARYYFNIENTGNWANNETAYDLDLQNLLPTGLTFTWSEVITNSGWSINLMKTWNNLTIDTLPYNQGNGLQFYIDAIISETVNNTDSLTLTWNLTYTSQDGIYTPVISNIINTERNWDKSGSNDYHDTDSESITVSLAMLDEYISVVDVNGGEGIIWDIFEYTITLTNTWSVGLTNIDVTHSIPSSFTLFTIVSTPIGSTDNSTSTGGVNNTGNLAFSGVTLNIWETKTIVYRVTAKTDVIPWTTVNTQTNVTDTPEWALWGTPDVDVIINAPRLVSTINETDENGWSLYVNEYITHTATIENTGTSTGTNLVTSISYSTGTVEYLSGSLNFMSGSFINSGSIIIDSTNNTFDFIFNTIAPGFKETFTFRSKAIWNAWDTVTSYLTGSVNEWVNTIATSNTLIIVTQSSGWGGWGWGGWYSRTKDSCPNWDYSPSKYDRKCWEKPTDEDEKPKTNIPKEENPEDDEEKKEEKEKPKVDKEKVKEKIKKYKELEEKIKKLIKEEEQEWKSLLKSLPKILPKTGTNISERMITRKDSRIDTDLPNYKNFKLAWNKNTDLNHWLQVLPEEDKNKSKYIVLPSNGLVIPVNNIENWSSDFEQMINWREIEVNKYLQSWTVEYPGTSTNWFGEIWNKVIFGHSSYWKKDEWRYKTHFQKIIELDETEQVWVYEKQSNWEFKRFKYIVMKSYNTDDSDTSVLEPGRGKNLTLFTCTPIWGISGRWIIKAKYVDEAISELQDELAFNDVSFKYKLAITKLVRKIWNLENNEKKQEILSVIYNKVDILLEKHNSNKKLVRIFELLQLEISKEILK